MLTWSQIWFPKTLTWVPLKRSFCCLGARETLQLFSPIIFGTESFAKNKHAWLECHTWYASRQTSLITSQICTAINDSERRPILSSHRTTWSIDGFTHERLPWLLFSDRGADIKRRASIPEPGWIGCHVSSPPHSPINYASRTRCGVISRYIVRSGGSFISGSERPILGELFALDRESLGKMDEYAWLETVGDVNVSLIW